MTEKSPPKVSPEIEAAALSAELERLCAMLSIKGVFSTYELKKKDPGWDSLGFERKLVSILREEEQRRDVNAVRRMRSESNLPVEFNNARFSNLIGGGGRKMDENVLAVVRGCEWMTRAEPADLIVSGASGWARAT